MINQNYTRPLRVTEYKACVKNIPLDMTKDSLQALFAGCANVISSKVLSPKDGRSSTIGFVGFATEEELGFAVETMNGSSLRGCRLVVEKARERNQVMPGRDQETDYQRKQDGGYHNEQSFGSSGGGMNHATLSQAYRTDQLEQPVFAANGPGRGRGLVYQYLIQTALSNGPSFNCGEIGVKREQAVFNPAGPGRGGVGVYHPSPTPPGRGGMVMNGMAGSHVENGDTTPYGRHDPYQSVEDNRSQQEGRHDPYQSVEDNRSQQELYNGELLQWSQSADMPEDTSLNGRLPNNATPPSQEMYATFNQSMHSERAPRCHKCGEVGHFARKCPEQGSQGREGGSGCFQCGETGHFARECPTLGGRAFDNSCHHCGGEGHFARDCPEAASSPDKGFPRRVAPVSYIPPELPSDVDELFRDVPHSGLNFDKYDSIPVQVTGREPGRPIEGFSQAELLEQCSINIKRAQFNKPTPIQKYAIPIGLKGRDLMACAQTGSGKTVAYLLPVLTNMIKEGHLSGGFLTGDKQAPAALCLAPTRELAVQIYKEVCKFSDGTVVTAAVCYGGVSVQYQYTKLMRGCHFLIATPGRLDDFVSRNWVSLENVRYLILDEADRMLDMGFEPAVRKLVERCRMPGKSHRQTLMFSATFPDDIQKLAADFLKEDYLFVAVGRVGGSNLDICQSVIPTSANEKQEKLFDILLNSGSDRTLIFVELKRVADFLACLLSGNNFPTTSISGDRTQQEREAALQDFRRGVAPVLVATSVAARGLDIPDVKHVINFDLPQDIEEYVHRIGRTGRIGNKGRATSFFQHGKDERLARSLVKVLSEAYQEVPEWLEKVAEEAIGSSYGPAGGKFTSRDRRERDHSRQSASKAPMASMTRGMEKLNIQSQYNGGPAQFSPRVTQNDENEEEWD